jgi:ABC-type sugar transport system ATPase subunit
MTATNDPPVLLRLTGIEKSFPGVKAIRSADIDVRAGEIHALVGENGAGKSTLIKVITGAHQPDAGQIELAGQAARITRPSDALAAGVAAIYQEFNLVPALTVRENIFLGREPVHRSFCQPRAERAETLAVLERLEADIDPESPARDLHVAHQQLVEIARALLADARLLIMDEPTAALTPREVERLFAVLADLREQGRGVLFISHRLDEVLRIADRVTVMRDGETLGTWARADLTRERLIELMVGRPLDQEFPRRRVKLGDDLLVVEDLHGEGVHGVSFTVRRGEVLGIAGLVGAGRTELARLIFGADRRTSGRIFLAGWPLKLRSPREAIRSGIALLTEDRKGQGLVLGLGARDNFALPNLDHWSRGGWINQRREDRAFTRFVEALNIRVAGPHQPAGHLSGGNQQKLLVARWLERDARLLIFDEPTRGIDVGAKYEMYLLMGELAARGKAIMMISSELPEILGLSDRILVMHGGRITGEIRHVASATQEQVLEMAVQW